MTTIARSPLDSGRTAVQEANEVAPSFDVERVRATPGFMRSRHSLAKACSRSLRAEISSMPRDRR